MIIFGKEKIKKHHFHLACLFTLKIQEKSGKLLELRFEINKLADIHTHILVYKHTDRG